MRFKGLESLQYVLVGTKGHLEGPAFAKFFEKCQGKPGGLGLPPSCDVQISVRRLLGFREAAPEPGRVERVSDVLMGLVGRAQRQILGRSSSPCR